MLLPVHLAVAGAVVIATLALVFYRVYEPVANHDAIAVGSGVAVAGLVVYVRYALGFPWLSATVVYLALFWMFHYGMASVTVVRPDLLSGVMDWEIAWLFAANTRLTLLVAVTGAAGFMCGAALYAPALSRSAALRTPLQSDAMLYRLGWLVMLVGLVASVFLLVRSGGLGLLSLGYLQIRSQVLDGSILDYAIDLAELGCLMAICGADGRRWARPLVIWAPLAGFLMMLGLRTEAMFPLVAFAIVLSHRGVRFPRAAIGAGALVLLVLIPAIRNFREVGFSNRSEVSWAADSPLSTLTELGGTLRAARAYVDWIEDGDAHQLGATYWAPVDRQVLTRLMPWRSATPLEEDPRVPSRNIEREGSVGLSSTGEAYYNFGFAGPFVFYGMIGALFGWLEQRTLAMPYRCVELGIAMLLLFFNIRDAWLAVPARAAMALVLVFGCHLLGRARHDQRVENGEFACS